MSSHFIGKLSRTTLAVLGGCVTAALALPALVSADPGIAPSTVDFTFACHDNSRDLTIANNTQPPNTKSVACHSGAQIDYINFNKYQVQHTITFSCPGGLSAFSTPATLSDLTDTVNLACKKPSRTSNGGVSYSSDSKALPSIKATKTQDISHNTGSGVTQSGVDASSLPSVRADSSTIQSLLKIFFGIIGGIAVLVVSIGGLRYILANGDPGQISQAKNTILYALVGLVVAITGFSIVTFVIKGLS